MDQRVERNVHNALVATTCRDDVGQYFLITPKYVVPSLFKCSSNPNARS